MWAEERASWARGGGARHFLSPGTHPIHLDHICVPVLGFYSLRIQLQREKERGCEGGTGDGSETKSVLSLLTGNRLPASNG